MRVEIIAALPELPTEAALAQAGIDHTIERVRGWSKEYGHEEAIRITAVFAVEDMAGADRFRATIIQLMKDRGQKSAIFTLTNDAGLLYTKVPSFVKKPEMLDPLVKTSGYGEMLDSPRCPDCGQRHPAEDPELLGKLLAGMGGDKKPDKMLELLQTAGKAERREDN